MLKDEGEPDPDTTGFAAVRPEEILAFLDPADSPGDLGKLASYRVLEVLGEGGMGVVLKAIDPALTARSPSRCWPLSLPRAVRPAQRFAREARAAAAIRNEHVVAIHSVDEWKGLPYLVMQFIAGDSLQERDRPHGPLRPELDLADRHAGRVRSGRGARSGAGPSRHQALQHPARERRRTGQDHRFRPGPRRGRRQPDAERSRRRYAAVHGSRAGPGRSRSTTAPTCSAWVPCFTPCVPAGRRFAPRPPWASWRVCDDTHRPAREVNPEIPIELAAIIDRLLAKEPAQRFQTAAEVAEKLEQLLARRQQGWSGEHEVDRAPVDDVGPVKRPRRHRMLQAAAYLLVLLSGAFVVAEGTGTTRVIDAIATVLRIKTPSGTLVLQVFDPEMKVQVDGQGVTLRGRVPRPSRSTRAHRVDKVDPKGNVSTEWISISRGDKLLVSVGREPDQPLPTLPKAQYGVHSTRPFQLSGTRWGCTVSSRSPWAVAISWAPGRARCSASTTRRKTN